MTFGQWLSFRGRIGRKTFWLGYVVPMLVAVTVANALDAALGLVPAPDLDAVPVDASTQVGPIGSVVSLLFLWPGLAGTIKRLHDRDRSGWWVGGFHLLSIVVGFIAGFAVLMGHSQGGLPPAGWTVALLVFGILFLGYGIWLLVETGFLRGTPGPNRFGPDPLGGPGGPPHWQQQGWQQPGAWPQQPPQQWQQPPPPPGWQPPPQQGWQAPPQGYGQPPPGYGQPPPGYGEPPRGSVPPIRRD